VAVARRASGRSRLPPGRGRRPGRPHRTYRERIPYVQIKDIDSDGGVVPLGTGRARCGRVVDVLRETGFDGWLVRGDRRLAGDPSAGTRRSMARLREALG